MSERSAEESQVKLMLFVLGDSDSNKLMQMVVGPYGSIRNEPGNRDSDQGAFMKALLVNGLVNQALQWEKKCSHILDVGPKLDGLSSNVI